MSHSNRSFVPRRFSMVKVFAGLAVAVLGGCLAADTNEDGSTTFNVQSEVEIVSLTTPTGDVPGVIVTKSVEYDCWDGELDSMEYIDTSYYAITGGKLHVWSGWDCMGTSMTGTSTTIQGTWTVADLEAQDSVPAAYRDPDCESEEEYEEYSLGTMSATYVISNQSIKGNAKVTLCAGNIGAMAFEGNELVEVVTSGCDAVQIRYLNNNKTATISYAFKNGNLVQKFTYAGKTCSYTTSLGLSDGPPICAEESDDMAELEEFGECVEESGFGSQTAGKRGVSSGDALGEVIRKSAQSMLKKVF
jgi:hypothetical protein